MHKRAIDNWEKIVKRVETACHYIASGKMIILTDDASRENEGDLVFAACLATKEKINFMIKHARGLVCLALEEKRVKELELEMMQDKRKSLAQMETAFTHSIDLRDGITTGISAEDRAKTILKAVDKEVNPSDFVVPGHIFPLRAKKGGVLTRPGHAEGSVDLIKLAGLSSLKFSRAKIKNNFLKRVLVLKAIFHKKFKEEL